MNKLFLDIETIPADKKVWAKVEKDLQLKYELKNKKPFNKEDLYARTALDGTYGRILCLGYLKEPPSKSTANILYGPEKDILKNFWDLARDVNLFIGHNIMDFDLNFIYKRSIIWGVPPTKDLSFARYRHDPIFDTMREWDKWLSSSQISLDRLAKILGLKSSKGELDGSRVYEYYQKGKFKEVYQYCMADVEVTRQIYQKMTFSREI
ncbi:MAG: ribonuclease H-like domain-containing protein [Patescibacteria group bacterium]